MEEQKLVSSDELTTDFSGMIDSESHITPDMIQAYLNAMQRGKSRHGTARALAGQARIAKRKAKRKSK